MSYQFPWINTRQISDSRLLLLMVLSGSFILSLIASLSQPILGRDAMLYLGIAADFQELTVSTALERFNWPWYPLFIGFISHLTGLSVEAVARLSCELMTAVACLLSVDIVRRTRPDLAGWAAMIVLAMPAFNDYRGDILRENGFWCFSMLAFWAMYRRKEGWHRVACLSLACLSIILAAAFRFEAVYIFVVLTAAEISNTRRDLLKIAFISGLFVFSMVLLISLLRHGLLPQDRITGYLARIDVTKMLDEFSVFAQQVAEGMPHKYARDDVKLILFTGLCGYLISKIMATLGVFSLPWLLNWRFTKEIRIFPLSPLNIAAVGYCGILFFFLINELFISRRYVAFLGFLLLPGICAGIQHVVSRWPKVFLPVVVLSVILAISNPVSLSEQKIFIRDAGLWIRKHYPEEERFYFDDARVSYYSGKGVPYKIVDRDAALAIEGNSAYEYFAFYLRDYSDSQIEQFKKIGLHMIADFKNRDGDTAVAIFRRVNASVR
jgi:hypothetical protein